MYKIIGIIEPLARFITSIGCTYRTLVLASYTDNRHVIRD